MNIKVHVASISFAVIFGFSFMFSKTALEHISPIALIAYRFLLAWIVFEVLRRSGVLKVAFTRKDVPALLTVSFFQPILYFLFETYGLQRTSSGEAGMMVALIPVFVAVLSAVVLKERPRPFQIFFIVLSVSGIFVVQRSRSALGFDGEWQGFLLLGGAVLSAALFNIASRSASRTLNAASLTYFMMLSGAVVFNGIHLVRAIALGDGAAYIRAFREIEVVVSVVYLGLMASILAFFLVNYALARLEAHVASIYSNIATIVAIAAGAIFLKEQLHLNHYIGSAMIVIGVYGTVRFNPARGRYKKQKDRDSRRGVRPLNGE